MSKNDADEEKDKGNGCIKEKKFVEAMFHYTSAIKLQPKNYTLYSNRSLAFKHMDQYYYAIEDAKKTISLSPTWAKGYFRLGEVQFATEHYQDALWSYKQAYNLAQDDETLKQSVAKAKQHLQKQVTMEKRIPFYGVAAGAVLGICIVISDLILAKNPVLQNIILQVLLIAAITVIGYGCSISYRYFMRIQRDGLLEEPVDLLGGMDSNKDSSTPNSEKRKGDIADNMTSEKKPRKRRSAAAARQQAKQSRS